jgi:hypothetical protein
MRDLADSLRGAIQGTGAYALFGFRLLVETPRALLRPRLVVEQVHNAGAMSLVIIKYDVLKAAPRGVTRRRSILHSESTTRITAAISLTLSSALSLSSADC